MIVYRKPPYPLLAKFVNSFDMTDCTYTLYDDNYEVITTGAVVFDGNNIEVPIPHRYDQDYVVEIADDEGDVFIAEQVSVIRSYLDGSQAESIARGIVDSVTGGFYYQKKVLEVEGTGADYIVLPDRINKILRVWENNDLVFDYEQEDNDKTYTISRDRSSIVPIDGENLESSSPIKAPVAMSDSFGGYGRTRGAFPVGHDYVIEYESGWPVIPQAVIDAMNILVKDIGCGADYVSKYITEYSTDQYSIKYSARVFGGTGNKNVDALLRPYRQYDVRAGLL